MQQLSSHVVRTGIPLGVLGLCLVLALIGCSSEPKVPVGPCNGPLDGPPGDNCLSYPDLPVDVVDPWEARTHLAPNSTYEAYVSNNVRLVLSYDSTANAFIGTVANRNSDPLLRVRVEVRLDGSADRSAHITLVDLAARQVSKVTLPVDNQPFEFWQVHTDVQGLNRIIGHP